MSLIFYRIFCYFSIENPSLKILLEDILKNMLLEILENIFLKKNLRKYIKKYVKWEYWKIL